VLPQTGCVRDTIGLCDTDRIRPKSGGSARSRTQPLWLWRPRRAQRPLPSGVLDDSSSKQRRTWPTPLGCASRSNGHP